jgi:ankyrin repeat protein
MVDELLSSRRTFKETLAILSTDDEGEAEVVISDRRKVSSGLKQPVSGPPDANDTDILHHPDLYEEESLPDSGPNGLNFDECIDFLNISEILKRQLRTIYTSDLMTNQSEWQEQHHAELTRAKTELNREHGKAIDVLQSRSIKQLEQMKSDLMRDHDAEISSLRTKIDVSNEQLKKLSEINAQLIQDSDKDFARIKDELQASKTMCEDLIAGNLKTVEVYETKLERLRAEADAGRSSQRDLTEEIRRLRARMEALVPPVPPPSREKHRGLRPTNPAKQAQFLQAAKQGKIEDGRLLLRSGAILEGSHNGWTALGCAAKEGKLAFVKFLIDAGAKVDICMDVGWGFLPGDGSALNWAASEGHLDIVKMLVAKGADMEITAQQAILTGTGGTPLIMAAGNNQAEVVKYLLHAGSDRVPSSSTGVAGWDAFICACSRGSINVVRFFVSERNINVQTRDNKGRTPLLSALKNQKFTVMKLLIEHGGHVDESDPEGNTLLHVAARNESVVSVTWLRQRGANLQTRNSQQQTALEIAQEKLRRYKTKNLEDLVNCLDWNLPGP